MKKIVILLILVSLISCSENKTTKITIIDSTSVDSTKVVVDTMTIDSTAK